MFGSEQSTTSVGISRRIGFGVCNVETKRSLTSDAGFLDSRRSIRDAGVHAAECGRGVWVIAVVASRRALVWMAAARSEVADVGDVATIVAAVAERELLQRARDAAMARVGREADALPRAVDARGGFAHVIPAIRAARQLWRRRRAARS